MKQLIFTMVVLAGFSTLKGQNQLDEFGRKTGPWKVEYQNGQTLYEGTFLAGKPEGLLTRYYNNGALRAKMYFDQILDRSRAELYYKGGKKAAEGFYQGKEKDGEWTYYSEVDGRVRMRETYASGKLHGTVCRYYPSGEVSEEVSWEQNKKEGAWTQYFEGGSIRLESHYHDNMLNGTYEVYFTDKILMMSGSYVDDKSEGTWNYFDEHGEALYTLEYKNGSPVDQEKYKILMQDTLLKYDTIETPHPVQFF